MVIPHLGAEVFTMSNGVRSGATGATKWRENIAKAVFCLADVLADGLSHNWSIEAVPDHLLQAMEESGLYCTEPGGRWKNPLTLPNVLLRDRVCRLLNQDEAEWLWLTQRVYERTDADICKVLLRESPFRYQMVLLNRTTKRTKVREWHVFMAQAGPDCLEPPDLQEDVLNTCMVVMPQPSRAQAINLSSQCAGHNPWLLFNDEDAERAFAVLKI